MITIDFETANYSYGSALDKRNSIVMVAWKEAQGPVKHFYGDIMKAKEFWLALSRHDLVCAFNCKFEMLWLKRLGCDVDKWNWHDPMLAEKILLGNVRLPMNLGDVSERYGWKGKDHLIDQLMKAGVCPSEMPQRRLIARCRRDVKTTYSLHRALTGKLLANKQVHLYRNRCDFAVVLAHIEAEGMILDHGRVAEEFKSLSVKLAILNVTLNTMTGGINMNSPDQKAHYLYGKLKFPEICDRRHKPMRNKPSKQFPNGRPKTDKDTLLWLSGKAETQEQKAFIHLSMKLSKASAAMSKNLQFFQGVCVEYEGKFHATFNQVVAATHRLTSSGLPLAFKMYDDKLKSVQFQNMPRDYKRLFKAPEGYKMVEVDAMQLEFRVAAFVGKDKQALKDIADPNFDAHIFSASEIFDVDYIELLAQYRGEAGEPLQKMAKATRQASKAHTFKPLYGGKRGTPGEEAYYRKFAERYSQLAATQENWLAEVAITGKLVTPWKMRFSWKTYTKPNGMMMDQRTHKPVAPQVSNYPVQNLATAEIVPIAIVALYRVCKTRDIDVKFVNTVHDSIICYVKDTPGNLQAFRHAAEWAFTTAVYEHLELFYNIEFTVPLGMEMVIGDHWSEGTETMYDHAKRKV